VTTLPVLIQRELLLRNRHPDPAPVETVVGLQRQGVPIVLVAEQTPRWRPTRRKVDQDLMLQQRLQQRFRQAQADLDGILYLPSGLFTRLRDRLRELRDLASRYAIDASDLILIGRDPLLLESVVRAGGKALSVGPEAVAGARRFESIEQAVSSLGDHSS